MPIERLIEWMTVEPVIGLLMTIAGLVLFAGYFARAGDSLNRFWPWVKTFVEAIIGVILFLGLSWGFRSILNSNIQTFNSTHGSLSEANRQSAYSIWGRPHVQRELAVAHFIEKIVQEEIPQDDPTKPPLYRDRLVREQVLQNSILGFTGNVAMTLSEREKGYANYAGYKIDAVFEYDVVNDSDLETEAEFVFPLSPGQTLFEDFMVLMDDNDISPLLRFSHDVVQWMTKMTPHQRHHVVIAYKSRGMDTFYYQIPTQRQINDFTLNLSIDRLPTTLLNYPEGVLTPTEMRPTADGLGSELTWRFNGAITTAGMGVALLQPEQPGEQVLRVLWNSPYALTILITMLALTLLIRNEPVRFIQLALLASAYCVQFLMMASLSDYLFGFWGSLAMGAALTGTLTFLLFRRHPSRLLRILVYSLVCFFAVVYPLAGLFSQATQRNSFDGLVQVSLIVYLFALSLYSQIEMRQPSPKLST